MNNYIKVRITGKNINNYLKWLIKQKIPLIKINVINNNELTLVINKKNYFQLKNYSKTYKIIIEENYGINKILEYFNKNYLFIIFIIISISILYILSNIIFSVDIISNNQEIVEKIEKELQKYNLEKYKFKKSNQYLNYVKEEILNNNKDILEWIEIETDGTKYIVKLVERVKENRKKEFTYQSITARKNAIIFNVKAYSGEKIKNINDYVNKDDIIISGVLNKPNGNQIYTKATGKVVGEVWYKVKVEYPYVYKEEKVTGKNKKVITIKFLNHNLSIFSFHKYKELKIDSKVLLENILIPIKIVKEKQYEVNIIEEIYTKEEILNKSIELAKNKILNSNSKIIEIKNTIVLNSEQMESKLNVDIYVSVLEDITNIKEEKPYEITE